MGYPFPSFFSLPWLMPQFKIHHHIFLWKQCSDEGNCLFYSSQRKHKSVLPFANLIFLHMLSSISSKQLPLESTILKELKTKQNRPTSSYLTWLEERTKKSAHGCRSLLPSSVMMGMLTPVVMDGWRNIPCTGLLSGEVLSIPGGVNPGGKKKEKGENSVLWKIWKSWEFRVYTQF